MKQNCKYEKIKYKPENYPLRQLKNSDNFLAKHLALAQQIKLYERPPPEYFL